MKTYYSWWRAAVLVVTASAVVAGSFTRSPWLFVAEGVALGALGAAFGAAWEMDARHRGRVARAWALRCAVSAVVLVGLPSVIGAWTLLVLLGLGLRTRTWCSPSIAGGRVGTTSAPVRPGR